MACPTIDGLADALDESLREQVERLMRVELVELAGRSALGQCLRRLEQRYLQELQ